MTEYPEMPPELLRGLADPRHVAGSILAIEGGLADLLALLSEEKRTGFLNTTFKSEFAEFGESAFDEGVRTSIKRVRWILHNINQVGPPP